MSNISAKYRVFVYEGYISIKHLIRATTTEEALSREDIVGASVYSNGKEVTFESKYMEILGDVFVRGELEMKLIREYDEYDYENDSCSSCISCPFKKG